MWGSYTKNILFMLICIIKDRVHNPYHPRQWKRHVCYVGLLFHMFSVWEDIRLKRHHFSSTAWKIWDHMDGPRSLPHVWSASTLLLCRLVVGGYNEFWGVGNKKNSQIYLHTHTFYMLRWVVIIEFVLFYNVGIKF